MRGGKVICFVDPWHALGKRNVNHSALPDLFKAWGVGYDHTKVLVDPGLATTTSAGEKDARMVTLGREQINRNSTVIGGLNQLFLIFSGAFHVTKVPGIDVQPLIESSRHAQVFDLLKVRLQGKRILAEMNQNKETSKVHALALSMKGDFSTAFPKGEPEYEVKGEGKIPPPPEKAHQKKSDGKGAVLLVADSDLLEDRVWVKQIRHPHSKELVNKITYDNATLLFNALEYYMGSTSLQTVRSRAVSLPRFTVVRDMEIEARRKFDDKVMALREEREAKEAFLRQYNEGIMLSPSQLQELDTYHKKLADIIREEKNLEREINRNINALGNRLMWLNIAAVPAFIMLLGLGIGLWRRFF